MNIAKGFMQDHTAHRDALTAAVASAHGTLTADTAKIPYPALKTQNDILAFAETVERTAASSYLDTVPKFKDRNLARLAASILGVETTHVTILEYTLKKNTEPYNDFVV
ncbi:MAG: ferritin-like domain-containing protein [Candidatus Eremiobacteraeota bacterium]|nr:ferritin-like domain-containing protein [Candidatus Eremiobacteraeota bacterium]